jgi:Na+-transporting NADH:ubiquinone oxidoreductase subunit C
VEFSNKYTAGFALLVCLVCSLVVSSFAVGLKDRQIENQRLDKQRNILVVAGLSENSSVSREEVTQLFGKIKTFQVNRKSGAIQGEIDFGTYDVVKAAKDPDQAEVGLSNLARVSSLPNTLEVYQVTAAGKECWILPIWGNGLWSTLYGYISIEPDLNTVKGITYYAHGETPGLGGEVDNPKWKALWNGKLIDPQGDTPLLTVVKKGQVKDSTHEVDGLSGATITSRAVGHMIALWFGEDGYGPFITAQKGAQ